MCPTQVATSGASDVDPTLERLSSCNGKASPSSVLEFADLESGLSLAPPPKTVPVRFLYDNRGSDLYEQITQLEEYYPYVEEKRILQRHGDEIAAHISQNSVVVELGCGDGTKTSLLLEALARRDGADAVKFVGIDVSAGALEQANRNLQRLCPSIPPGNLHFFCAEYLNGLAMARAMYPSEDLCIFWLGSSVGNLTFDEAAEFLAGARSAAGDRSSLLLCCDLWKDPKILHAAYDDSQGITRDFIINGMNHALRTLGHADAEEGSSLWQYEAVVNTHDKQVEMWVQPTRRVVEILPGVSIEAGERVLMEISRKLTPQAIQALAQDSGYCVHCTWATYKYSVQLLLPVQEAFRRCWADTDALFDTVRDWNAQPIGLRHPFCFYYGHVAAFARMKALPAAAPRPLDVTLSRGIDPNVLDPSKCHSHPDVPDAWPGETDLRVYVASIREELLAGLTAQDQGQTSVNGQDNAAVLNMRAIMMVLEHERMHQETLCYMLAQERKRRFELLGVASDGFSSSPSPTAGDEKTVVSFYFERCRYDSTAMQPGSKDGFHCLRQFVHVGGGTVALGIPIDEPHVGYLWDNEKGNQGPISVSDLHVGIAPITVAAFHHFVFEQRGYDCVDLWGAGDMEHIKTSGGMPATWSKHPVTGDTWVHMPEGSYRWQDVADCPVYVSLAEAQAFANKHGCRLMSEAEHEHLIQQRAAGNAAADELQDFASSSGWEWTGSLLEPFPGFEPDELYPEYSTDFFDGEHYVLRGQGCPYTHPSMRRSSFRNFYQRLYPFMFAKFRLVKTRTDN